MEEGAGWYYIDLIGPYMVKNSILRLVSEHVSADSSEDVSADAPARINNRNFEYLMISKKCQIFLFRYYYIKC